MSISDSQPKVNGRYKRDHAVALQYDSLDQLPTITASGVGEIARRIIALAEQHDIPICQDETLNRMLAALNVGDEISPESFKLVAQVISFLYHTDQEWQGSHAFLEKTLSG